MVAPTRFFEPTPSTAARRGKKKKTISSDDWKQMDTNEPMYKCRMDTFDLSKITKYPGLYPWSKKTRKNPMIVKTNKASDWKAAKTRKKREVNRKWAASRLTNSSKNPMIATTRKASDWKAAKARKKREVNRKWAARRLTNLERYEVRFNKNYAAFLSEEKVDKKQHATRHIKGPAGWYKVIDLNRNAKKTGLDGTFQQNQTKKYATYKNPTQCHNEMNYNTNNATKKCFGRISRRDNNIIAYVTDDESDATMFIRNGPERAHKRCVRFSTDESDTVASRNNTHFQSFVQQLNTQSRTNLDDTVDGLENLSEPSVMGALNQTIDSNNNRIVTRSHSRLYLTKSISNKNEHQHAYMTIIADGQDAAPDTLTHLSEAVRGIKHARARSLIHCETLHHWHNLQHPST
jgi:hypothetical protein